MRDGGSWIGGAEGRTVAGNMNTKHGWMYSALVGYRTLEQGVASYALIE